MKFYTIVGGANGAGKSSFIGSLNEQYSEKITFFLNFFFERKIKKITFDLEHLEKI